MVAGSRRAWSRRAWARRLVLAVNAGVVPHTVATKASCSVDAHALATVLAGKSASVGGVASVHQIASWPPHATDAVTSEPRRTGRVDASPMVTPARNRLRVSD